MSLNKTYKKLQEQFKILRNIEPNNEMLKYQKFIKKSEASSINEYSEEYNRFMDTFDIPYGTIHRFVLRKCLNVMTTHINNLQKPSKLENEVTAR